MTAYFFDYAYDLDLWCLSEIDLPYEPLMITLPKNLLNLSGDHDKKDQNLPKSKDRDLRH